MLLAADIGNTNITIGLFSSLDSDRLEFTSRLVTDRNKTADQYAIEFYGAFILYKIDPDQVDCAIICSVVPVLTDSIAQAVKKLFGVDAVVVGPGVKSGLDIKINNPAQLGADIVAVSVAAKKYYPLPNAVCDLGTASTISVLDKNGSMIGVIIFPGVNASLDSLVDKTSLLQLVSLNAPARVVGKNTVESIQSGVVYGTASQIDGLLNRAEKEIDSPLTVIATGGLAGNIMKLCDHKFEYSENLVLIGLRLIYNNNL